MIPVDYEAISKQEGYSVEDLQKGYSIFNVDGVTVIQKIDCLESYGLAKFDCDTLAGEQAVKDGIKTFMIEHENYRGWHILDTEENRKELAKQGILR